jgi:hypothetical protein
LAPRARISRAATENAFVDELGIEARGQADRLREAGRVAGHVAVQGFVVHQHRNAQAGAFHRPFLGGVGVAGGFLGVAADRAVVGAGGGVDHRGGLEALAVGRARDLAQAVGEVLAGLFGRELALGGLDLGLGQPDADQLGGLFLQRHSREQVAHPQLDRLGRILVDRFAGGRRGAGQGRGRGGQGGQADAERTAGDGLAAHDLFASPLMDGPSNGHAGVGRQR